MDDQRDQRIAASETIGCALATLRRFNHVWCDADIRMSVTQARLLLAVAQSRVKERIDEPNVERTQNEDL